ncbi:MAG TPA: (2Fe-2S)-binding protein [Pseudonocardiaceae bacterium]|nr:(2Fe-2S)-binding protein [Pseudonocardiaceae bacterium]
MTAALAEIRGWGPFFAVRTEPPRPPWRPVRELLDPGVLAGRVDTVRRSLGSDMRVAASVAQLGLAARLVAPPLGLFVHSGAWLAVAGLWWRGDLSGAFPLATAGQVTGSPDELIGWLGELVDVTAGFSVSRTVLWGNVASALNGAATVIGAARPDLAAAATAAVDDLPVVREHGVRGEGGFRRRSCCLIYRATGRSAVCGDCVLSRW